MTEFLPRDPQKLNDEIVEKLYKRLDDVRRTLGVRVERDDEFEQGINCRASNEEFWLEELLTDIEMSR
jgi:predicted secreted protein